MAELSLEHASFLAEYLLPHASVWRKLGTALKFRQQDLDNIQSCLPLLSSSPYSFMQKLVEEWIEGKYPHTAPPTLPNLRKALNSHAVGLGILAKQIRDSLPQHNQSVDAKVFEIVSVSDQGDITFSRSEDIKVDENTHVHLKVEVSSMICKWSNTGSLSDYEEPHCGLRSGLCIQKADIDMDGKQYSCDIIDHDRRAYIRAQRWYSYHERTDLRVTRRRPQFREDLYLDDYQPIQYTIPVTLRVNCPQLDQFKRGLASIYLAQPEVPRDSWPPVSNRVYINLALVKQQKINYGGEYVRLTIRGDMDDILRHKEKIEYKNIFDGLRSGSLFLIEGRPGSGKTTFVHKITRDWATGEVQGPRRLVLLVSLRVLNGWKKPVTLEDILQLLNMQVNSTILQKRNGKGLCFIFDGLDEFSPLEGENSIVYKIINKTYLPQSIVIVASRPAALVDLRQRADKVIEIIGFLKDQIFEYVKNYPFSNTLKADQLNLYLLDHPNVLHMCYLPIHAAMVAYLFEVIGKVPRTETEIYTHFTRLTLKRSLSKHKGQDDVKDMDINKLSGEEKELFDTICKFALEKTIQKKQVLDEDELKLHLHGKGCKDISLGLITVDRTAGLYHYKNIYTFLHLTYQEYLAAHHISTLSGEDQHKLIKEYGDTDHMQVVWKFYCGLVNFEEHQHKIKALVSGKKKIFLSDIQCAYESQQKVVCNCFMKEVDAQIILEDKYLTTSDFTALGYLLANSPLPISLSLTNCNMNNEAVSALLKEKKEKPLCLRALTYESDNIDLESLLKLLSKQHSLECLKISSRTTLRDSGFSDIINTSLINLKEISLINIQIEPTTLTSVLQFCKELSFLTCTIKDNPRNQLDRRYLRQYINEESVIESLLTGVSNCKKLEGVFFSAPIMHLSVWCTIILARSSARFYTPADLNKGNTMVYVKGNRGDFFQTLILKSERTNILEYNLESTSKYWPPRPKLLIIVAGFYCDDIINLTSDFSVLEKLYLKNVHVNTTNECRHCGVYHEEDRPKKLPERVTTILAGLRSSSNLQKLFLSNMYFKLDDSCILAFCLQHWPKLQELHLRGCGIKREGAKAIADNIKCCPELTEVELSEIENDKKSILEGIATIITGLKNCSKLQKLVLSYMYIKTDDARVLASCLKHWPKLQELHLRGCGIEDEGAKAIADNIKCCPGLIKVDLSSNKTLTVKGITTILTGLKICSNLQNLVLNNICIKTAGVHILASCLQHWPKLQELHLKGCAIGDKGAKVIADNIKYCPELTKMDLSENKTLIAEGITAILTSLKNCSNLQKLVLDNVNIKTDDARVLASCLQHWPKLQELHLRGCGIEEEGAKAIADNIKYCPELTDLEIISTISPHKKFFSYNISEETIEMIKSSLQSHKNMKQLQHQKPESQQLYNSVTDPPRHQISESQQLVTDQSCHQISESQQPATDHSYRQITESQQPVTDQLCHQISESQLPVTDQSCHQISESQQPVTDQLCHQISECQQPVTDQSCRQISESQQPVTDQSCHQMSESQQPVTDQLCHQMSESQLPVTDQSSYQMSESQQPQDKIVTCKNVSSVGRKGGRHVWRRKWRKIATRSNGTLPLCETELDPKSSLQEVNCGSKSQNSEMTFQDAGPENFDSVHASLKPIIEPQNPEFVPPVSDHVTVIEFDSKNPMQVGFEPSQNKNEMTNTKNSMPKSPQNNTSSEITFNSENPPHASSELSNSRTKTESSCKQGDSELAPDQSHYHNQND